MMPQEMKIAAKHTLIIHEGLKNFPYIDSIGKVTIGIGYNLTDRGLSDQWIHSQCEEDMDWAYRQLYIEFAWFSYLNEARQIALVNMAYNLGWKRFLTFKRMILALNQQDFDKAAEEMLDSKWAKQVGQRANDLANIMLTGHLPKHLQSA